MKHCPKKLYLILLLLITLELDAAGFKAFCDSKACNDIFPITAPRNL